MAQPTQAPLPNFGEVGAAFRTIGMHMKNCGNLPGYNEGARVIESLQQLNESIRGVSQQVEVLSQQLHGLSQRMDGMGRGMDELKTRTIASDNNNRARTQNARLTSGTAPLEPLRNPRTNEEIPNFPATAERLTALNDRSVRELLELLDAGTGANSTTQARKQRLRSQVGLKPVPA